MTDEFFIRKKVGIKGDAIGISFPKEVLEFLRIKNKDNVKLIPRVDDNGKRYISVEKDTDTITERTNKVCEISEA